jgi:hypothetical protein
VSKINKGERRRKRKRRRGGIDMERNGGIGIPGRNRKRREKWRNRDPRKK